VAGELHTPHLETARQFLLISSLLNRLKLGNDLNLIESGRPYFVEEVLRVEIVKTGREGLPIHVRV